MTAETRSAAPAGAVRPQASVLFVCTANICRSPYAAFAMRGALDGSGLAGIATDCAGTRAPAEQPVADRVLSALERHGIDASGYRSRALDSQSITTATVILTAEAAHRSAIAHMAPTAMSRVFTVRQFARLVPHALEAHTLRGTPAERLTQLVEACAAARGMAGPAGGASDDIEDPWGRSAFAYRRTIRVIDAALNVIVKGLAT